MWGVVRDVYAATLKPGNLFSTELPRPKGRKDVSWGEAELGGGRGAIACPCIYAVLKGPFSHTY